MGNSSWGVCEVNREKVYFLVLPADGNKSASYRISLEECKVDNTLFFLFPISLLPYRLGCLFAFSIVLVGVSQCPVDGSWI